MQQRQRLLTWVQIMIWASAVIFISSESQIANIIPTSGVMTLAIFGGYVISAYPRKNDKYNLFCWYHIAMAIICALVGVLDIINFYIVPDISTIANRALWLLKYTVIVAGAQTLFQWLRKTIKEIKNERSQQS